MLRGRQTSCTVAARWRCHSGSGRSLQLSNYLRRVIFCIHTTASYCIHTCPALSSISSRNPGEISNLYLLFNVEMLFKSRFPLNFASTKSYSIATSKW